MPSTTSTIKIKSDATESGFMIINESDFDGQTQELWTEPLEPLQPQQPEPSKPESLLQAELPVLPVQIIERTSAERVLTEKAIIEKPKNREAK